MTVRELIAWLQTAPPDAEVLTTEGDCGDLCGVGPVLIAVHGAGASAIECGGKGCGLCGRGGEPRVTAVRL